MSASVDIPAARPPGSAAQRSIRYVLDQYPPAQALSVGLVAVVTWLLYGRIAGDMTLEPAAAVAALTVVLLLLHLRLADDLDTFHETDGRGDVAGAQPAGLVKGLVVSTAAIALLDAVQGEAVPLAVSLGAALMMSGAAAFLIARYYRRWRVPRVVGLIPLFEIPPAIALGYVYVDWAAREDASLALGSVLAVVAVVWTNFQFWKFSRHIGKKPHEAIYGLSWHAVRWLLLAHLAVAAAAHVGLHRAADLSPPYLVYALAVVAVFAVLARPRPAGRREERSQPAWVGLPYPTAILAGLLVQLAVLA